MTPLVVVVVVPLVVVLVVPIVVLVVVLFVVVVVVPFVVPLVVVPGGSQPRELCWGPSQGMPAPARAFVSSATANANPGWHLSNIIFFFGARASLRGGA